MQKKNTMHGDVSGSCFSVVQIRAQQYEVLCELEWVLHVPIS